MEHNIDILVQRMIDKDEKEAFKYAEQLGKIGTEEVLEKMLFILKSHDTENVYLASRVLGKIENNERALGPLLEVIHDKNNIQTNGGLVESLESFDLREKLVDIFRIYLFGNYKASILAKEYLDYTEFDISPRIIKKAEKHWNHYKNNIKQDEAFEIKKREADSIFKDLHALFDENNRP